MVSTEQSERYEFRGFCLDRRRRSLSAPDGESIHLNARAFDALVHLLENPGRIVERSELMAAVWPDTVVEENNLSQAIAAIRRILGDGFIETVPRRGYHFIATVSVLDEPSPKNASDSPPSMSEAPDGGAARHWARYLLAAALLLVAGIAAANFWQESGATATSGEAATNAPAETATIVAPGADTVPTVAVLPCDNLSPNPDDAYFASGIHQEIVNQLSGLRSIRVIARTSVMQFAESRPPVSEIARRLQTTAVVECGVRYAGSSFLVTAQLTDPTTETQVWSNSYPGDLSDLDTLFAVQSDIAANIAGAVRTEISPTETGRLAANRPTESEEAYVAFLRALEADPLQSFAHLERAIELDPGFATAYAWRGMLHLMLALSIEAGASTGFDYGEQVDLAVADAERALAIDENLGLAHIVSSARYLDGPDHERINESIDRALELSPNNALVLYLAATWYLSESRADTALPLLERLVRLDPASLRNPRRNVGEYVFLAGGLDTALELDRQQIGEAPTSAARRHVYAFHLALRGDDDAAIEQLAIADELLEQLPDGEVYQLGYLPVYAYGRLGRTTDARRVFDRFMAPVAEDELTTMKWIIADLGLGNIDGAYERAARMAGESFAPWSTPRLWLVLNPMNDPALEQQRFLDLRRQLGLRE